MTSGRKKKPRQATRMSRHAVTRMSRAQNRMTLQNYLCLAARLRVSSHLMNRRQKAARTRLEWRRSQRHLQREHQVPLSKPSSLPRHHLHQVQRLQVVLLPRRHLHQVQRLQVVVLPRLHLHQVQRLQVAPVPWMLSPHAQSAFQGHAQAALEIPEVPRIAREHVFLDFARNYNWIQLGQMLEEDGTLINVTANGLRWSALHQASRAGEVKVVEYLLSRRADHTMRNPQGKLPLDLADHKAIKRLLAMAEAGSLSFEGGMPARPNAVGGILSPEEGGNAAHYYYPPGYSIGQTYAGLRRARWMEGEE